MAAEVDNYLGLLLKQGVSSDIVSAKEKCQIIIKIFWQNSENPYVFVKFDSGNIQRIMGHKTIHMEVFGIR